MIEKMTWIQFDREYSEFTQWPLELNYNVYCDLVDEMNKQLEELKDEKAAGNTVDLSTTD